MGLGAFEGLLAEWTTFWGIFMLVEVQVRHGLAGAGVGSRKLNAAQNALLAPDYLWRPTLKFG
jgi:hypothetical protein